ncbi:hypothetical protein C1646_776455 [Rhizophagus diaphanus]|nr:hypothetical protein C1646_776455 [Rhizophagus diaphanus] [Rhizophagus sp. MUCL 43196]
MNRNFIFAFVLFITLFNLCTVNASPLVKRSTTFNQCTLKDVPTLIVSMSPDPPQSNGISSFTVSGVLKEQVIAGTTVLLIVFADATGERLLTNLYTKVFEKSFAPGETVSIAVTDVGTPGNLPSSYTIGVGIGNPDLGNPISPLIFSGCTYAVIA